MKKYLSIKVVGHDFIKAWENPQKKSDNKQPDFKGDGIAVWVYEYGDEEEQQTKGTEKSSSSSHVVEEKVFED